MGLRQMVTRTALAVCALFCALPAHALASASEQSILMDDNHLIYATPSDMYHTLQQAKALGIDRIKVSMVWYLVAPKNRSKKTPRFDATNPAAYPPDAWERYDFLASDAQRLGLQLYFDLTPPAPAWGVARGHPTEGYPWSYRPSAREFGQFVQAVGRRYSGHYVPGPGDGAIPRVNYWGIWNEPDEGAWLNPQWRGSGGGRVLIAPMLYRQLVDSTYSALRATGHGGDTILIGETASRGWILPLPFVQALYCVGANDRPVSGAAASAISCPRSGSRRRFVSQNPGLFAATGYAHHPYSFDVAPNRNDGKGTVTLVNLGVLERTLNRIFRSYGKTRRGGVPMYLTEWGYKSNPPNPFVRTSLSEQATWLNQGEYMTYRDGYVRALNQFLLYDDKPRAGARKGSRAYWSTFQSGLLFSDGGQKPAYDAFVLPIWLPSSSHGHLTVWGELRPANHGAVQIAQLLYQRRGTSDWTDAQQIETSNSEGFFLNHVSLPAAGAVRIAWVDPSTGQTEYSRTATVH